MKDKHSLYYEALQKWGLTFQVNMAIEEMAELTKVLLQSFRHNKTVNDEQIHEELADVEIMIEQLKTIYGFEAVERAKKVKLLRLEQMLKKDL